MLKWHIKILMDEIFGRENHLNTISMTTNAPSGFKATSSKIFSTVNFLSYAKDKNFGNINKVYLPKDYDKAYNKVLLNKEENYKNWKFESINEVVAKKLGYDTPQNARKKINQMTFQKEISKFAISNADIVFRTAAIECGAKAKRQETIDKSKENRGEVFTHPNDDIEDFYISNGEGIIFYEGRLQEVDGNKIPAELLTDVWVIWLDRNC